MSPSLNRYDKTNPSFLFFLCAGCKDGQEQAEAVPGLFEEVLNVFGIRSPL